MSLCKNCGIDLPAQATFCSNCGAKTDLDNKNESTIIEGNSLFTSQEVPKQSSNFANQESNTTRPAPQEETAENAISQPVPSSQETKPANENINNMDDKTYSDDGINKKTKKNKFKFKKKNKSAEPVDAPITPVIDENTTEQEAQINKPPKKMKTALIICISVALLISIIVFLLNFETAKEMDYIPVLIVETEDEVYLIDGEEAIELCDVKDNENFTDSYVIVDNQSAYVLKDLELDEDSGVNIGTLYLVDAKSEEEVDTDVVEYSMKYSKGYLWYDKFDDGDFLICSAKGIKPYIVWDGLDYDDNASLYRNVEYIGLPDGKTMYIQDSENVIYKIEKQEDTKLMKDAQIHDISDDYRYILLGNEDGEIFLYDGKDSNEVYDNKETLYQGNALIVDGSKDVILLNEDDELIYIPYNKEEIEIDDDVEYFASLSNYANDKSFSKKFLYTKSEKLYLLDLNKREPEGEKILSKLDEISYRYLEGVIYVADDDTIDMLDIITMKETSLEIEDTEDLDIYDIKFGEKYIIYLNEDAELCITKNGEEYEVLEKNTDDMSEYGFGIDEKSVLWIDDGELIQSSLNAKDQEDIIDDVSSYYILENTRLLYVTLINDDELDLVLLDKKNEAIDILEDIAYVYIDSYIPK